MYEVEINGTTAVVCYCMITNDSGSRRLCEYLYRTQELFENAGFKKVKQAFAVGKDFPKAVPFREYPVGFRARLDEIREGHCSLENLILSYGLLSGYHSSDQRHSKEDFYLILLINGMSEEMEEDMEQVIEKFKKLKQSRNLKVCCLSEDGGSWAEEYWKNNNFTDVWGMEALEYRIP